MTGRPDYSVLLPNPWVPTQTTLETYKWYLFPIRLPETAHSGFILQITNRFRTPL